MPSGSAIKTPKDLAGKKVAVNTLNNINTTTINEIVRKDGGDPSGIQYVELAFPDIPAAVSKGDVDAGQVVEPFLASGTGQGMTNIGSNYAGTAPNLQVAMYFTSVPYMQQNAETVTKFTKAINKSLAYAQEHPDEAREVLTKYTKIDEKTRAAVTLPQWSEQINTETVNLLARTSAPRTGSSRASRMSPSSCPDTARTRPAPRVTPRGTGPPGCPDQEPSRRGRPPTQAWGRSRQPP